MPLAEFGLTLFASTCRTEGADRGRVPMRLMAVCLTAGVMGPRRDGVACGCASSASGRLREDIVV